jgi:tetratricopeptide (TPR) repeat protein
VSGWTSLDVSEVGDLIEPFEVQDVLDSLVEKSMVVAGPSGRWRLLETVRDYGRGRLALEGEAGTLRNRHLGCFLGLAETAESELQGPEQGPWLERLETEHDNLRAALDWSRESGMESQGGESQGGESRGSDSHDSEPGPRNSQLTSPNAAEAGLRLCGAVWRFWLMRGYSSEGRTRCAEALAHRGARERAAPLARSLNAAGCLAMAQGDSASAQTFLTRVLVLNRELGNRTGEAGNLNSLAIIAYDEKDYSSARSLHEESLALSRELGDRSIEAANLSNLAYIARDDGDYPTARSLVEQALTLNQGLGNRAWEAVNLCNLGSLDREQGHYTSARSYLEQALTLNRDLGNRLGIVDCVGGLAAVAAVAGPLGDPASLIRAVRLWGAADRLRDEIAAPLPPSQQASLEEDLAAARQELRDDEAFDAAWQQGRAMTLEQAVELALEGSL